MDLSVQLQAPVGLGTLEGTEVSWSWWKEGHFNITTEINCKGRCAVGFAVR